MNSNDDIPYFSITYKLLESDGNGGLKPFIPTKGLYTANVEAETAEEAKAKLKKDFNMMTVEILSVSDKLFVTREEYENG